MCPNMVKQRALCQPRLQSCYFKIPRDLLARPPPRAERKKARPSSARRRGEEPDAELEAPPAQPEPARAGSLKSWREATGNAGGRGLQSGDCRSPIADEFQEMRVRGAWRVEETRRRGRGLGRRAAQRGSARLAPARASVGRRPGRSAAEGERTGGISSQRY